MSEPHRSTVILRGTANSAVVRVGQAKVAVAAQFPAGSLDEIHVSVSCGPPAPIAEPPWWERAYARSNN